MRRINEIIVHCTATPEGRHVTIADVDKWHRARKFNGIGYHFLIYLDGTILRGRPIEKIGAHCIGHNRYSIGVCYIGGCAKNGKTPKDTRTPEQKDPLAQLLTKLHSQFQMAKLYGHRELVCTRKQKDVSISCADCLFQYKACKFAAKICPSFDCHEYDYIFNQQK